MKVAKRGSTVLAENIVVFLVIIVFVDFLSNANRSLPSPAYRACSIPAADFAIALGIPADHITSPDTPRSRQCLRLPRPPARRSPAVAAICAG